MSSVHSNARMPTQSSSGSARAPLRARQMNTDHGSASNGKQQSSDPPPSKMPSKSSHSSSSHRTKSSKSAESVEIEEHRRKPNGEGHTVHRYIRGKMLGKGGFAKVYLCTSLDTDRAYAVKIVPKANLVKTRARQKLQAEIKIHRSLKHKHICEYKHFFEDKLNCYILLELCHNQSMNELIKRRKRLTEPEVKYFLSQLLESVLHMHNVNVIHRDLKLGNLFLDKHLRVKVGDFGLATKLNANDEKRKTICGTPNYIAPEVIDGDKQKRGHSFEVDVWSMGVICYTLLIGKPPYESKDVKSTYQRILRNEYSFPSHVPISQHARDLISSMLQTKPEKRPSLETIIAHPFFTHDPMKIPQSLPSCCTHVAPDWQEDEEGYLVPILAEADIEEQKYRPKSSRRKDPPQARGGQRETNVYHRQQSERNKENEIQSRKQNRREPSPFEIYSENQPSEQTNSRAVIQKKKTSSTSAPMESIENRMRGEERQEHNLDYSTKKVERDSNVDDIAQKLASCAIPDKQDDIGTVRKQEDRSPCDSDARALETMYSRLRELGSRAETEGSDGNLQPLSPILPNQLDGPTKWVTRYVDYTSKYGLGFLFNDGSAGVYFNDSTKAVLVPKGESFVYVERKKSNDGNGVRIEQIPRVHYLSNHPDSLQKKVTLLKHFRNYLIEQHKRDESGDQDSFSDPCTEYEEVASERTIFVKKWVRTKHAILFRLSNHTVQVLFYDHTEIFLTSEARIVTYVNKQRGRDTFRLDDIMSCSRHNDIKKRLKYAEGILQQLISGTKK